MANPASIMRTVIQVEGFAPAVAQLQKYDAAGKRAAAGTDQLSGALAKQSASVSASTTQLKAYDTAAKQATSSSTGYLGSSRRVTPAISEQGKAVKESSGRFGTLGEKIRSAGSHVSGFGSSVKNSISPITRMASGIIGIGAAFVAYEAAKQAIAYTSDLAEASVRLHAITGLDIKTSSTWIELMKTRGVSTNVTATSFITLSKNIRAGIAGTKAASDAFSQLGISQDYLKTHSTQQVLLQTAEALKGLKSPAQQAALAQQLFGRGASALIPVLLQGKKGLDENLAAARRYGAYLPNNVKQLEKAKKAQFDLNYAMDGLKIAFTRAVLPFLAEGARQLLKFIAQMHSGKGAGGEFANTLSSLFHNVLIPVFKTWFGLIKTLMPIALAAFKGFSWYLQHLVIPVLHLWEDAIKAVAWVITHLPEIFTTAFYAIRKVVFNVVRAVLGVFSSLIHAAADVFDVMSHLPIVGGKFGKLRDAANNAADGIDHFRNTLKSINDVADATAKHTADVMHFNAAKKNVINATNNIARDWKGLHQDTNKTNQGISDNFVKTWNFLQQKTHSKSAQIREQATQAIIGLKNNWNHYLQVMVSNSQSQMNHIANAVQDGSSKARGYAISNFHDIAQSVGAAMNAGELAANQGAALIGKALNSMLTAFGQKPIPLAGLSAKSLIDWEKFWKQGAPTGHPTPGIGNRARGGLIDKPTILAGEEAPRYPEMIVSTNPAYRKDNMNYVAQLAAMFGLRHFAKGGYVYPYPSGTPLGRTDQGVDTGIPAGGLFRAMGDAVIGATNIGGWPGGPLMNWQLTSGNAAGRWVYLAEMIRPLVHSGQRVAGNMAVASSTGPSQEMGWWTGGPSGETLAQATGGYSEGQVTAAGRSFLSFIGGGKVGPAIGAVPQITAPHVHDGTVGKIAQAALDRIAKGANAYMAAHMPITSGSGVLGALGPAIGSVEKQIYGTLSKEGWNKIAVAAAIGNAFQESGLNPGILDSSGQNGGLWGFTSGAVSLASLKAAAASKGVPWTNVPLQSAFMAAHYGDVATLNAYRDPAQAALYFMNTFEKPLASAANIPNRESHAQQAYAQGYKVGGMLPPFGGIFGDGGIVPGPLGAPRTIIAHGGEPFGTATVDDTPPIEVSSGPLINIENMHVHDQFDEQALAARLMFMLEM